MAHFCKSLSCLCLRILSAFSQNLIHGVCVFCKLQSSVIDGFKLCLQYLDKELFDFDIAQTASSVMVF